MVSPNHTTIVEQQQAIDSKIEHEEKTEFKRKIVWLNVNLFAVLHLSLFYGIYLLITSANLKTLAFFLIYGYTGALGVTVGMYRLWSHRAYKARWPLRVILMILTCISAQNDIHEWCRDHRVHHKVTETVAEKGKTVYLDDLRADPIVHFQKRFYTPMVLFFCIILPTVVPVWCWGETIWNSFFIAGMTRYYLSLNLMWLVNSAAHYMGYQPFKKNIESR